ncbi:MAG TPA: hypothetical protein VGQ65_10060 [Thermoanaerobaculia bacterium]|jgi:hypothetical protein|nr:hypothetical protein [Thermoanaerobaculia bacterium]
MTAAAEHLIEDFEALPEPEKREVLTKLLHIASHLDYGPISDEELESATDALFVSYDAEEQSE